ncbi:MAG: hypothetical protein M0P95_08270 [Sulfuritalea sp.]|jgi:ABC-type branched-subunit amino acid transport system ATPase component|nr:hypothetical protein [Sulfuritalea sp.]
MAKEKKLAAEEQRKFFRIALRLKSMAVPISMAERTARAALQLADYGHVSENGSVAVESNARILVTSPCVIEFILVMAASFARCLILQSIAASHASR